VARVTIVGLGPAGVDLLPPAASAALAAAPCFVRTMRHPAATAVPSGAVSFDEVYERSERIEDVYATIVERVVGAALEVGHVVYVVPGSPVVAEHTVELLVADPRVTVELVPAMSFLDLAWVRLGVDPVALGARVVDGHRFDDDPPTGGGPWLIAQCDRLEVLSDIKLSVDDPGEATVVVLQRLGLADESIREVAWNDLDRSVVPDHLTCIWVPAVPAARVDRMSKLEALMLELRAGCPWDAEQTHGSLRRYLLEETHEVLEVLDEINGIDTIEIAGPGDQKVVEPQLIEALCEELGDLVFQVVFHSVIAAEHGWFDLSDVLEGIHDKLVRRHPHVFGDVQADTPDEVLVMWEANKAVEKQRSSVMDGIPAGLPALARAAKVMRRARGQGWDLAVPDSAVPDSAVPDSAVPGAAEPDAAEPDAGEALWALVADLVDAGLDPEDVLRATIQHFVSASRALESAQRGDGA